ncbi:MAG: hypothetical protein Q8P95_03890 [bacterium]|nr:hypothetical protein [bacterium]
MKKHFSEVGVAWDNTVHGEDAALLDLNRGVAGVIDGTSAAKFRGIIVARALRRIMERGLTLRKAIEEVVKRQKYEATFAGFQRTETGIAIASIGDSRLYHIDRDRETATRLAPPHTLFRQDVRPHLDLSPELEEEDPEFETWLLDGMKNLDGGKEIAVHFAILRMMNYVLKEQGFRPLSLGGLFQGFLRDAEKREQLISRLQINRNEIEEILREIRLTGSSPLLILEVCITLCSWQSYNLASAPERKADYQSDLEVRCGDLIVCCTDGIAGAREQILAAIRRSRSLKQAARKLLRESPGFDDATVVIAEIS